MLIREYQQSDYPQLLKLFDEFGDFFVEIDDKKMILRADNYAKEFSKEMFEKTKQNGVVYVAEDGGVIAGFIAGNFFDLTSENSVEAVPHRKGRILEFFVSKRYRGHGVGKHLMLQLEKFFVDNNCHAINIEVFAANKRARKFYEDFGYTDRNYDMMKIVKHPTDK